MNDDLGTKASIEPGHLPGAAWRATAAALAIAFACALFTTAASALLYAWFLRYSSGEGPAFMTRLAVKGIVFTVVTIACAGGLWRLRARLAVNPEASVTTRGIGRWLALGAVLLAIILEVTPNLDRYPRAEPDETYHLIVARNLAEFGLYASGNKVTGFNVFDAYDSVGAPVIVPVAGALRTLNASLDTPSFASGRIVMVLYYLVLCLALYLLASPVLGHGAACVGLIVMTGSFGSSYLARTLYGEAPALAFVALGLLAWRRAIARPQSWAFGAISGMAFGLAVLCKSIMALAVFPLAAVWLFDRLACRRIRPVHVLLPAVGAALVVMAWWGIQMLSAGDVPGTAVGTLSMYRHNLMFGYRSVGRAAAWMLGDPLALAGVVCGMAAAIRLAWFRRYDPALAALQLIAIFYAFWWTFFTPAQIPRYMWFTYAIGGLFAGGTAWNALRYALDARTSAWRAAVCVALILVVMVPATLRIIRETGTIYTVDETRDDYEVADMLRNMPDPARVDTTYWPLQRTADFLAHRTIHVVDTIPTPIEPGNLVIMDTWSPHPAVRTGIAAMRVGRYAILTEE